MGFITVVLEHAAHPDTLWQPVGGDRTACEVTHQGRRHVVVDSPARRHRDDHRREEPLARTETQLIALGERVRAGRLADPAKIGAAVERILAASPLRRCFTTRVTQGRFHWDYNQTALDYETRLLAGRYVLTTSLAPAQATTAEVVAHYHSLANVERRFRVMKDFLALRSVYRWTEQRVRGHIAICVLAAVIEAVIANTLAAADLHDPDRPDQTITARRALAELNRIRVHHLQAGDRNIAVITRRNALQAAICAALGINTTGWDSATIT